MLCTFRRCGNWLREAKWMVSVSNLVVELDLRTGFVSFLSFCPFFPTSHLCSNYYPHSGYLGFPGGFWILSFKAACPFPASRAHFVWALGFLSSLGESCCRVRLSWSMCMYYNLNTPPPPAPCSMCPMLCLFPDPGCPVNGGFTGWVCCLAQLYQWMVIHFLQGSLLRKKVKVLVTQWCLTLYDPIDYSPPGFSVHGILQARILKWVAILFSRGLSQSRYWIQVFHIAGRFFTIWTTRETHPSHIQTSSKLVCLQWEMEPVGVPRCMPFGPWGLRFALLCELQGCVPMRRSLCIYTEKSIFKYWDKILHGKRYRFFTKDFWSSLCQQQLKMCRLRGWQRM